MAVKWFIHIPNPDRLKAKTEIVNEEYILSNLDKLIALDADIWSRCLGEHWVSSRNWEEAYAEAKKRKASEDKKQKIWYLERENLLMAGPFSDDELKVQLSKLNKEDYENVKLHHASDMNPQKIFENPTFAKDLGINLRKHKRIGVSLPVELIWDGGNINSSLVSLSEEGCGILLPEDLKLPSVVTVKIKDFGYEGCLSLKATFLYHKTSGSGFKLQPMSQIIKSQIISHILKELRPQELKAS